MISELKYCAPLGKSHHSVLTFDVNYETTVNSNNTTSSYLYNKGNFDAMRTLISNLDWEKELSSLNVNESWSMFENTIRKITEKFIPKRKFRGAHKKNKWMTKITLEKSKKKEKAYKQYLSSRNSSDYLKYTRARNQAKWECRKAVKSFELSLAKEVKSNPKAFYSYAKSKSTSRSTIPDLSSNQTSDHQSDLEKANLFVDYFTSVFTRESTDNTPQLDHRNVEHNLADIDISPEVVLEKLLKLNTSKSPGPDSIHPRILKELSHEITIPLQIIFKKSLEEGKLPKIWKTAEVIPLHKKGRRDLTENYRPISLTCIVCKLLESIIRDHILNHIVSNNLITSLQHGFVPKRSCFTNLLNMVDKWTSALDDGIHIDAIYLDFSKAFDTVPHQRLLHKLEIYGISGKVLAWISEFLTNRKHRVRIFNTRSKWREVLSGVPQGSVLATILFIIYIDDLPNEIISFILLFADDSKLYKLLQTNLDYILLTKDLNKIEEWCNKWCMRLNIDKCKVMHLGRTNPKRPYYLHQENGQQQIVESSLEKDLGVHVDNSLHFSSHVQLQVNKANRIFGLIKRTFAELQPETFKLLFTSLMRPLLEYCAPVWSPIYKKDRKIIENVLRRASSFVPKLKHLTYSERLQKLKIQSMQYRRRRADMIETYKLLHNYYDIPVEQLLPLSNNTRTRGHALKIAKPYARLNLRKNFFCNRIVDDWNSLPSEVVSADTLSSFKAKLDALWLEKFYVYDD